MHLTPGTRLGRYEIVALLGAGGMGVVYRARDPRLGRDVAIKLLPTDFVQDAERLARFEREARLLASLSHTNIAGIHGLEEADGARYLVLEFVEGETLAERLTRGPLPVDDAVRLCAQVAAAVEAAHEAGIVHRDVKPGNIMLKSDGTVKVLDFGLARAAAGVGSGSSLASSPTVTRMATSAGVILGTAAYMSPEQARGHPVDRRTDIWSFGCVLYECLTGTQLFGGETVSDIIARILKTEPDWEALPASTPPRVLGLIKRCLDRDPKQRLRDIGEARITLQAPEEEDPAPLPAAAHTRRGLPLSLALLAALALVAITAAAVWVLKPPGTPPQPLRVLDLTAADMDEEWFLTPTLSPDGSRVAYMSEGKIWVRDLDRVEPRTIADLDEPSPIVWSPDAQWIAFARRGKLLKVSAEGGSPVAISDIPEPGSIVGGTWGLDDSIIIAVWRGGLHRVSPVSGKTSLILASDPATQVDFHFPSVLPDGGILYVVHWKSREDSVGNRRALLQVLRDGEAHGVESELPGGSAWPAYQDGVLLMRASRSGLFAMKFDPARARIISDPVLVIPDIASFTLANDGSLLYMESRSDGGESEIGRIDRTGAWKDVIIKGRPGLGDPALSPDARRIAFTTGAGDNREIWIHDLVRDTDTRLTFESGYHDLPRWLDNDRIIYAWLPEGMSMNSVVLMHNADGLGAPRRISDESATGTGSPVIDTTGDPGRFLQIVDAAGRGELRMLTVSDHPDKPGPRRILREDPEPNVLDIRMSPDGQFLAYVADLGRRPEVFLTRFPSGEGKWQVSTDGGFSPRWSHDSRTLYFVAGSYQAKRHLVTAEVDPAAAIPIGVRRTLFSLDQEGLSSIAFGRGYEVAPNDDGFLVVRRTAGAVAESRQRMVLVQNWRAKFDAEAGHRP